MKYLFLDVDECEQCATCGATCTSGIPCSSNETCTNSIGYYSCGDCPSGYTGPNCTGL